MANEVKINCYTIKLRTRRTKTTESQYLSLDTVKILNDNNENTDHDFIDFFARFIHHFDQQFAGVKGKDTAIYISLNDVNIAVESRIISGFVKGGKTGTGRSVVDYSNPEDEIFRITPDHVDAIDFYFLIWLPQNSNTGLLMVQGLSTQSVSDTFCKVFKHFCAGVVRGQVLEIDRFVPRKTVEQMKEEGNIDKIVLRRNNLAPDRANSMLGVEFITNDVNVELRITGLKDSTRRIKQFLDEGFRGLVDDFALGEPRFFTTPILEEVGMDGNHDVAVEYEFNGKKATAKQSKGFELAPFYYVDEDSIERNPLTNLPTRDSIKQYCLSFFQVIRDEMIPE